MATITVVVTTKTAGSALTASTLQPAVDDFTRRVAAIIGGAQAGDANPVTTLTIA